MQTLQEPRMAARRSRFTSGSSRTSSRGTTIARHRQVGAAHEDEAEYRNKQGGTKNTGAIHSRNLLLNRYCSVLVFALNAVTGSPVPGPDGFNRKQTVVLAVTQDFYRLSLPCSSGKPIKVLVSKTQRMNDKLA